MNIKYLLNIHVKSISWKQAINLALRCLEMYLCERSKFEFSSLRTVVYPIDDLCKHVECNGIEIRQIWYLGSKYIHFSFYLLVLLLFVGSEMPWNLYKKSLTTRRVYIMRQKGWACVIVSIGWSNDFKNRIVTSWSNGVLNDHLIKLNKYRLYQNISRINIKYILQ